MINIGEYNKLKVSRFVDFGCYLADSDGEEVLLPKRYLKGDEVAGADLDVFVYNDSENRPVATTECPTAAVGDFALMRVKAVNNIGAFLDWGLVAKDLLVPFREQRVDMKVGRSYIVYVYLDKATDRVVASAKLDKFIDSGKPGYYHRQKVDLLVTQRTEIGYKVIVDGRHWGMIYQSETYRDINIGDHIDGYVKQVRPDGKVDVTVEKIQRMRVGDLAGEILDFLSRHEGKMTITDKSTPEEIRSTFNCSKKDFKKAIGQLYREHKVILDNDVVAMVK